MRTLLACLLLSGLAPGRPEVPPVGTKVVTKYAKPLRIDNEIVDDGAMFRIYTVEQKEGGFLWLVSGKVRGKVPAIDVIPYADAVNFYTAEIQDMPGNAGAHVWRGLYLKDRGKLDAALDDFTEAIRIDPRLAMAYTNRGNVWQAKGEYDRALADYDEAIRLDRKGSWAVNNRGHAWGMKKDYARALADYDEAIRLHPKNPEPYNNRAWEWATCPNPQFRDGKKAVESARKACELSLWNDANHLGTLAAACAEAGDFDQAVTWELAAIKLPALDENEKKGRQERLALYRARKPYRRP